MAEVVFDPHSQYLFIDLINNTYKQSVGVNHDGLINRQRRLAKVQACPNGIIRMTYFDTHTLQTVVKIFENRDRNGNLKEAAARSITYNALKVKTWKGETAYHVLKTEQDQKIEIEKIENSDLAWESDMRYFGLRDCLLGNVPLQGKTAY